MQPCMPGLPVRKREPSYWDGISSIHGQRQSVFGAREAKHFWHSTTFDFHLRKLFLDGFIVSTLRYTVACVEIESLLTREINSLGGDD